MVKEFIQLQVLNTLVLKWQYHINDLSVKLNRANALLFKIRKFVNDKILRFIYFAIFESHLNYCPLVWAQNYNAIVLSFYRKNHLQLQTVNLEIFIPVLYLEKLLS